MKLPKYWVHTLLSIAVFHFQSISLAENKALINQEKNKLESTAKASAQHIFRQGASSDQTITQTLYPIGTQFYINEIHPASPWKVSDFQGSVLTATTCSDGATKPGINMLIDGDRKGWHDACFTKAGDPEEFYVYGFNFSLVTTSNPSIDFDNYDGITGELILPNVKYGEDHYTAKLINDGNWIFRLQSAVKK